MRRRCSRSTLTPKSVEQARKALPAELADQVSFKVASAEQLEIEPGSFDLVVFSWSL